MSHKTAPRIGLDQLEEERNNRQDDTSNMTSLLPQKSPNTPKPEDQASDQINNPISDVKGVKKVELAPTPSETGSSASYTSLSDHQGPTRQTREYRLADMNYLQMKSGCNLFCMKVVSGNLGLLALKSFILLALQYSYCMTLCAIQHNNHTGKTLSSGILAGITLLVIIKLNLLSKKLPACITGKIPKSPTCITNMTQTKPAKILQDILAQEPHKLASALYITAPMLTSIITSIATDQLNQAWLDLVIYTIGSGTMVLALKVNKQRLPDDPGSSGSNEEAWRQLPPAPGNDTSYNQI